MPSFPEARGKHYLSIDEVKALLSNAVVMEEKIDGKIDGVMVSGNTIFFEFMKYRHTIPYMKLPSWQMAFDVWNGKRFLGLEEKTKFLTNLGYSMIRKIFYGTTTYEELLKFLPKILALKSAYGDEQIEGVVIKNYEKQLFGKIVNPKFEEEIDSGGVHWTKKPVTLNRLLR